MSHFTIARLVAAGSLVLALGPMPYAYYSLMRMLVCAVNAYAAYQAFQKDTKGWLWVFGIMAA